MAEEEKKQQEKAQPEIIFKTMEDVMHESMLPYSEHVILDRALPRVEDGLKPVQRRILYTMLELNTTPDKPYRKSARIVGDCLGKYHPHGDTSIYDAMVRMAQDFNMRMRLVDGHGNFGSVDGDGAAAMRYTEVRMAPLALELLRDLEKDTVRWSFNFDDTLKEPDTLPGRFPNLLVNGASGIAVGLATNIPPHNLAEVIDGVVAYIDSPSIKLKDMMRIVKGPDFPTGGYLVCGDELTAAYETGKGKLKMRAKIHIENGENEKKNIVIDELPYQVNKATLLESILTLREEKKGIYMHIAEICDESDRNGMRAVIRVKRDGDPKAIIEALFKATNLQCTFGINMVAIADGKPQQMGLMDIIVYYVNYQREIVLRRTRFELAEAKEREHILEGLVIAVKNIDEVVRIIKKSESVPDARQRLRDRFKLSERQAQAILDMRLARLTHLEIYKLEKELAEVRELITRLTAILNSKKLQMDMIKTELLQIKKTFKEPRKTVLLNCAEDYTVPSDDDVKPVENYVVAVNENVAVKKLTLRSYSTSAKEFGDKSGLSEICPVVVEARSDQVLYCFTDLGNCFKLDMEAVPEGRWRDNGKSVREIAGEDMVMEERVVKVFALNTDALPKGHLLFYTRDGMVKRSAWSEYGVIKSSFQAIKLKEGDAVLSIEQEIADATILFVTKQGMCLNADKSDVPEQGRVAGGVKGIQLSDGDACIAVAQVKKGANFEAVMTTDRGFAKRTEADSIDVMARYRKGVKIYDLKGENGGELVFARIGNEPTSVIMKDTTGYLSPYETADISKESRTGKGKACFKGKDTKIVTAYVYNK
ncbi:DNA gyrase subunit A [Clostridia bacterium]|nr:DNA gyrase subunit A [Clostridia bacterium]